MQSGLAIRIARFGTSVCEATPWGRIFMIGQTMPQEDCEKVMAKFMDTFDSAAHPVDWECVHAHFAPPDSYVKHDGQDVTSR